MGQALVEICCGSAQDVYEAAQAGAGRVELNAALFLGGLTPSIGMLQTALGAGIEVMAMVRPREGGFCYTEREFETMLADAHALLEAGADGIVFGTLLPDGTVDAARCQAMLEVIGPGQSVFHRAIDVTPDWHMALDVLCSLGITRVLTSGQAQSVQDGAETVREMALYTAGRIELLPGGGVSPENAREILTRTGCNQIHASLKGTCTDTSAQANPRLHFIGASCPPEDQYTAVDGKQVRALLDALKA